MKRIVYTFFTGVLILGLLATTIFFYMELGKEEDRADQLYQEKEHNAFIAAFLKSSVKEQLKLESTTLKDANLVGAAHNRQLKLSRLLSDGPRLVFYFTGQSCDVCVNQELKNLRELAQKIGKSKIAIIMANPENTVSDRLKEIDFADAYVIEEDIIFPTLSPPVLFHLDAHLNARLVFKPSADLPVQSLDYYPIIIDRFFADTRED